MRSSTVKKQNSIPWRELIQGKTLSKEEIYPEELEQEELDILATYPEDQRNNLARVWAMKEKPWMNNLVHEGKKQKTNISMNIMLWSIIFFHGISWHPVAHGIAVIGLIIMLLMVIPLYLGSRESVLQKRWYIASIPFDYLKKKNIDKSKVKSYAVTLPTYVGMIWLGYIITVYLSVNIGWAIVYVLLLLCFLSTIYIVKRTIKNLRYIHHDILQGYYNSHEIPKGWT